METGRIKEITFISGNDRRTIGVNQSFTMEKLNDQLKVLFNFKSNETLAFIEDKKQMALMAVAVHDLWEFSTDAVPIYQIIAKNSK